MISVLMPTFNAEKYLDDSIQSILKQNFKDFEFIIFDDCSTDDSYEIIKKYSLLDKRIIHHKNSSNTGYTDLLNEMVKIAKYDFIARMDADDISHKNRLTKQIEFIHDKKYYSVVGSFIKIIDDKGNFLRNGKYPLEDQDIKEDLKKYSTFAHPSTLIRKSFFEEVKGYRKICEPAEDYDLWTRLAGISKLHNLPEFLLSYREHQKGISQRKREEQLIKTEFIKKNYLHILKGKDLVKEKNLVEINEQLLYDLINKNEFIFEKNYSLLASYLKNKKFFKFTYIFLKTLIKNPKFLSCRVFSYIKKNTDINKFVICKINGGLGNQLFNFLNGLYLAKKYNYKILIDETRFIRYKKFKPILSEIIKKDFAKKINFFHKVKYILRNIQILKDPDRNKPYYFDDDLLENYNLKTDILLDGYFQSFLCIKTLNLDDLKIILKYDFFDGVYKERLLKDQKKKCAIHIRRGDFYNESQVKKIHGLLNDEYFIKSVKYLHKNQKINEFYVFSDDIEYCKNLFKDNKQKFIFVENMNETESFKMLTFFSYYIISNSTYSLLASFIAYKKKIVDKIICPMKWYKNYSTEDLNIIFDKEIFKIIK